MAHGTAFMQNKDIAKLLKEAIDAPLGSSKREKAKKLVAVLRGVGVSSGVPDGQGGPGTDHYSASTPGSASYATKAPRKDPDYSNMVIFPAPPAARRGNPLTKSMATGQNAQAGINYSMQNNPYDPSAAASTAQTPAPAPVTPPQSNFNQYASAPDVAGSFGNIPGAANLSGTPTAPAPLTSVQNAVQSQLSNITSPTGQGGPGDSTSGNPLDNSWTQFAGLGTNNQDLSKLSLGSSLSSSFPNLSTPPPATTPAPSTFAGGSLNLSTAPNPTGSPTTYSVGGQNYTINAGGTGMTPAPTGPSSFTNLKPPAPAAPAQPAAPATAPATPSNNDYSQFSPVVPPTTDTSGAGTPPTGTGAPITPTQTTDTSNPATDVSGALNTAIGNNTGAGAFADQTMNNPALLKEIFPGMSNIPSGNLSDAVKSLETSLQQQYQIPQLQSQMLQMTSDGATLGPLLQTYIQNTNTSLNDTYKQIQNAQTQMLRADTGNPYESATWARYSDYLNNLYSAQNQSYANFYNQSINAYQGSLTALNTTLSDSISQYNSQLQTDATLTEADYNRIHQSLSDMYTAAQQAPTQELELATMQAQLAQAQAATASASSGLGTGKWADEYKKLTSAGVLFNSGVDPATGATNNAIQGTLLPSVTDLGTAMKTILSDDPSVGTDGALNIIQQAFTQSLGQMGGLSKAIPAATNYSNMIQTAAAEGYIPADTAQTMIAQLGKSVSQSVYSYVNPTNGTNQSALIKKAVADGLTGNDGSWFGLAGGKVPSQTEFVAKYQKQGLDAGFLNQLWTTLNSAQAAINGGGYNSQFSGMTPDQIMKSYVTQINAMTPTQFADFIASGVAANYGYATDPSVDQTNPAYTPSTGAS